MPQDHKLNINGYLIITQGRSWSVINAAGDVIARFPDKQDAIEYARRRKTAPEPKITQDAEFGVFKSSITPSVVQAEPPEKLKNDAVYVQPRSASDIGRQAVQVAVVAAGVVALGVVAAPHLQGIFQSVLTVAEAIFNNILFKIGCLGTLIVGAAFALDRNRSSGEMAGCFNIFFLLMAIAVCNALGVFSAIWNWVF